MATCQSELPLKNCLGPPQTDGLMHEAGILLEIGISFLLMGDKVVENCFIPVELQNVEADHKFDNPFIAERRGTTTKG